MSDLISREDVLKIALEYTWGGAKVLRQRISALPAVQPRVKPLVWETFGKECLRAETVLGRYEVMWGFHNGQTSLDVPAPRRTHTWHSTLEAAKAAAQADYESRILSALEPAVQPDAAEQAIRDAMTVGMGVVRIAPEDFFKTAETRPDAAILEAACIAAHNAYEAAAHEAGWITNTQSRKPWVEVPEANKIAMRAGIGAAIALIDNPGEEVMPSEARPNRAAHDTAPAGLSAGGGA